MPNMSSVLNALTNSNCHRLKYAFLFGSKPRVPLVEVLLAEKGSEAAAAATGGPEAVGAAPDRVEDAPCWPGNCWRRMHNLINL